MSVDISDILHVLAHELRTPVGIAHGYVRLLLEDRLPEDADRRRALEQMQKALGRLSDLSRQSTALASWYERDGQPTTAIAAARLLARVAQACDGSITVETAEVDEEATVRTLDAAGLADAIANLVRATARELRGNPCRVCARVDRGRLEVLAGAPDLLPALAAGPGAPEASPLALERGGLGLALVHAAVVLDAHGAERWTVNHSRQVAGFRLPLEERPHQ